MAELGTTLNGQHQSTQGQHHHVTAQGQHGTTQGQHTAGHGPHTTGQGQHGTAHRPSAAGRLPSVLIATRHGESTANVEFQLAEAAGALSVPISCRDADIPLSLQGRRQAQALGHWWAGLPSADRPRSVWCSPYVRTAETARIALAQAAGLGSVPVTLAVRYDERLRDRELGVLEMLPKAAIEAKHPEEAARRRKMGELYYRPPGGESWADVALRVRSLLRDLCEEEAGRPVLLVAHDCTVLMLRYALDRLTEDQLTALGPVHNCSTSLWRAQDGRLRPDGWNGVGHLTAGTD
ncbi:histidine phosphatase family protein [Kitasatospora sp. MY 5-36]|uniref:histidine phosphatase family protein n=1 Tax=Kitasatospora sp. MY 5-36 TaxID=1678027 RepID=UPI000A4B3D26|nr:histidine phosphatase family protein [Kitasatospora sp. MY 5-36]